MKRAILALVLLGCGNPPVVETDAAIAGDAGPNVCGLPSRIALEGGGWVGGCESEGGASAGLIIAADGSISIASTGATGASAVSSNCGSGIRPSVDGSGACSWTMNIACDHGILIRGELGDMTGDGEWVVRDLEIAFDREDGGRCTSLAATGRLHESGTP